VAQVGEAVTQMDQATQQNAALVEEMAAAASSLEEPGQRSGAGGLGVQDRGLALANQPPQGCGARRAQPKGVTFQGTERRADAPKISAPRTQACRAQGQRQPELSARAPTLPKPATAAPAAAPAPAKTAKAPCERRTGRTSWETF